MSRSKKKPWFTDKPVKGVKSKANRAVRQADDVPSGKAYRKYYESWDIRDWAFHAPKDKKAYRK